MAPSAARSRYRRVIWRGLPRRWRRPRLEEILGYVCPLTVWEHALRGGARPESFIGRWVSRLFFYQASEWVFTTLYCFWPATGATLRWFRCGGANPAS
jgi:hypothetical protein